MKLAPLFSRSLFLRCAAGLVLAAGAVFPLSPLLAATPAPTLDVPKIGFSERVLPNGLEVISVRSNTSPTVSVQVWYHVGARDDPQGRSGFAHLFEHLMFKSTKYLKAEQFDRLTEDVGGSNNAFTSDDVTAYHEVVPSNHLETLLWAEAERMSNLNVDDANFKSERAVVEEEYRQRILASPYGRFFNAIAPAAYLKHPYKRPSIGSIEDLEAATLDDVTAFHTPLLPARQRHARDRRRRFRAEAARTRGSTSTSPRCRARPSRWSATAATSRPGRATAALPSPGRRFRCRPWRSTGSHRRSRAPTRPR